MFREALTSGTEGSFAIEKVRKNDAAWLSSLLAVAVIYIFLSPIPLLSISIELIFETARFVLQLFDGSGRSFLFGRAPNEEYNGADVAPYPATLRHEPVLRVSDMQPF